MNRSHAAGWAASALVVFALTGALVCTAAAAPSSPRSAAAAGDPVTHEENNRVAEGGAWTQHYFPSSDDSGTELHADVLLPEGLAPNERVPVILSVGPYFGHSGEQSVEDWKHTGPSNRFYDFIKGTDLFDRGYAFVMVDSRGFGGSNGCLDGGGRGEQADIQAAIDWAANQPWSTGAVGMYGKSYDAITGLIGNNLDQDALKAVVAQEPVWDMYQNAFSNGVQRPNSGTVPLVYNKIATLKQMPDDDPRYRANAQYEKNHQECLDNNLTRSLNPDPRAQSWKARDMAKLAKGSDTPLFITQGFTEWITKPEGMREYLDNHRGVERGWLGPWDHVRGNEVTEDGRLAMGREGWFQEMISFYDQHLKGVEPPVRYPRYAVQDNTGTWRAQDTWPVVERSASIRLGGGSYVDDGGRGRPGKDVARTSGFVKWSEPVDKATRITGTPRVSLNSKGRGNVMLKLYDVAPDGTAVMFDEQVSLLDSSGKTTMELKSTDWTLAAGHRLAVEIGTIRTGDWMDKPSQETISVQDAKLTLALDNPADDTATSGNRAPYLETYLTRNTVKLRVGSPTFTVPTVRG